MSFVVKYLRWPDPRSGDPRSGVLDHWLRRRVPMCYWKHWRFCRTKVRNLLILGTSQNAAISVGLSRKGPWRLSRILATQTGMTNRWLKKQGLISIKELWVNICPPQEDSLSGYDPISFVKRPVRRRRMLGVVGDEGEKPSATRLGHFV